MTYEPGKPLSEQDFGSFTPSCWREYDERRVDENEAVVGDPQTVTIPAHGGGPDPDEGEGRNDERAEWARSALDHFKALVCGSPENEPDQEQLGDLLGDLMHLCHRDGIDFTKALQDACSHFVFETSGDN